MQEKGLNEWRFKSSWGIERRTWYLVVARLPLRFKDVWIRGSWPYTAELKRSLGIQKHFCGSHDILQIGGYTLQIRHGPQILARSSFPNRSSCYVYHAYPAWDQGSGILHAIDGCGPHWGILRKTWRCGGNKVKDSEKWEVKQDTWDGFAPASAWHSSGLRESSDIILVLSCMPRNPRSRHFSHSSTTVIMYLELVLPVLLRTESAGKEIQS